jgi:glycosyltransferase involved in cell wall biosynthesis|tara:strand:- start:38103 stop:39005 length:903 start_codon:yes stop_codon:yes gene_type:complete
MYESEGYTVIECLTDAKGFVGKHRDLLKQYKIHRKEYDALLVNFPGYYLMPIAWWLTRFPRKQVIFDAFISVSDTLVSDRRKVSWANPLAWMYYIIDVISCFLADEVLIDTEAHKRFFMKRFFLKAKKIRVVYVGTLKDLFHPGPKENKLPEGKFNALFIGSYIPLQGIEHILHAAKILNDQQDIHITLIGNGQTYDEMTALAYDLGLKNVTFLDFMPIEELPHYLRSCDVALGIFGTSDKANRVIPHKVYDAIGCKVPVITAQNLAIGEKFTDGKEVFLCKTGNAESLAQAIVRVKDSQ